LSKEHYQQQSYMEPLLIVHQQRFIDTTTIDIEININNSSTYEPLLIYRLQQWFHVEPLLILDTINLGPAFRLKSLGNFCFPRTLLPLDHHQGSDWSARCHYQDPVVVAAAVPGPFHRHHHPRVGTSSMQPS
jgi:hypothetical protein